MGLILALVCMSPGFSFQGRDSSTTVRSAEPAPSPRPLSLKTYMLASQSFVPIATSKRAGWLLADARIDGRSEAFCVDTGSAVSFLDTRFRRLLSGANDAQVDGMTANFFCNPVAFKSVHFQSSSRFDLLLSNYRVTNVAGIIGHNFLSSHKMIVDLGTDEIYYNNSACPFTRTVRHLLSRQKLDDLLTLSGFGRLHYLIGAESKCWYLQITIKGKECRMLVDSGATSNYLFGSCAQDLGHKLVAMPGTIPHISGNLQQYRAMWAEVELPGISGSAPLGFRVIDSVFTEEYVGKEGLGHIDGILGMTFLEQFGLICDYNANKLYINPLNFHYDSFRERALDGEWIFESISIGKREIKTEDEPLGKWSINGSKLGWHDTQRLDECRILVAPWATEKRIDIIPLGTGRQVRGIYTLSDGRLIVCLAPSDILPTSFVRGAESGNTIITMRRSPAAIRPTYSK